MYQSKEETDDDYMQRFRGNVENLCAAWGAHVLCSDDIMEKAYLVQKTKEKLTEVERFKAVMFLKQSDKSRHGKLLSNFQDGA